MRFQSLLMAAAVASGGTAAPSELFPDPGLSDVLDSVDGWEFQGLTAMGGTGPGISFVDAEDGPSATLMGSNSAAMLTAWGAGVTKTVTIAFANYVDGNVVVNFRGFAMANFSPALTLTFPCTAGLTSEPFTLTCGGFCTFDVTHISVT